MVSYNNVKAKEEGDSSDYIITHKIYVFFFSKCNLSVI